MATQIKGAALTERQELNDKIIKINICISYFVLKCWSGNIFKHVMVF